jgi:hypothetical protein
MPAPPRTGRAARRRAGATLLLVLAACWLGLSTLGYHTWKVRELGLRPAPRTVPERGLLVVCPWEGPNPTRDIRVSFSPGPTRTLERLPGTNYRCFAELPLPSRPTHLTVSYRTPALRTEDKPVKVQMEWRLELPNGSGLLAISLHDLSHAWTSNKVTLYRLSDRWTAPPRFRLGHVLATTLDGVWLHARSGAVRQVDLRSGAAHNSQRNLEPWEWRFVQLPVRHREVYHVVTTYADGTTCAQDNHTTDGPMGPMWGSHFSYVIPLYGRGDKPGG